MFTKTLSFFFLLLVMAFLYIGSVPPYFLFFLFFLGFLLVSFYVQEKYQLSRFWVSLPLSRETIIQSHYVYLLLTGIFLIIIQCLLMQIASWFIDGSYYVYHWKDLIILICLTLLLISLITPIFYISQSFIWTSILVFIGVFVGTLLLLNGLSDVLQMETVIYFNDLDPGFHLLIEKYIAFQPYILFPIITLLLWIGSTYCSIKIFEGKDL